jgi:hypothetical protein
LGEESNHLRLVRYQIGVWYLTNGRENLTVSTESKTSVSYENLLLGNANRKRKSSCTTVGTTGLPGWQRLRQ